MSKTMCSVEMTTVSASSSGLVSSSMPLSMSVSLARAVPMASCMRQLISICAPAAHCQAASVE